MKPGWAGLVVGGAVALAFVAPGTTADHEAGPPSFTFTIRTFVAPVALFEPAVAHTPLHRLTFVNEDAAHHDLFLTATLEPIGFLGPGQHVTVDVEGGVVPFFCAEHPAWMHGAAYVHA